MMGSGTVSKNRCPPLPLFCGALSADDGSPTLSGGWMYTPWDGAWDDPGTDPGYFDAVNEMLHIHPGGGGRTWGLGSTISLVGNIASLLANYLMDCFWTYQPPVACLGPVIYDGDGQSCESTNIACKDDLDEACLNIDAIPDVSNAFKQCMKGRCGCGGSSHRRLRISCADSTDCGPCDYQTSYGCNIGGSRMWYCSPDPDPCECYNTVFHEMSHACGALDQTMESYRIGEWFRDQCIPVSSPE